MQCRGGTDGTATSDNDNLGVLAVDSHYAVKGCGLTTREHGAAIKNGGKGDKYKMLRERFLWTVTKRCDYIPGAIHRSPIAGIGERHCGIKVTW